MVIRPSSTPLGGGEARGGEVELLGCQSGVIGAFESMVYETGAFTFAPGDMLFMYTDGTIEARDRTGAFFGEQRLRDLLLSVSGEGVSGICGKVLGELDRFTESALDGVDRRPRRLTGKICAVADTYASSEFFWGTMVV